MNNNFWSLAIAGMMLMASLESQAAPILRSIGNLVGDTEPGTWTMVFLGLACLILYRSRINR